MLVISLIETNFEIYILLIINCSISSELPSHLKHLAICKNKSHKNLCMYDNTPSVNFIPYFRLVLIPWCSRTNEEGYVHPCERKCHVIYLIIKNSYFTRITQISRFTDYLITRTGKVKSLGELTGANFVV